MVEWDVSSSDLNEYIECSIPENIFFSEYFENLVRECKSIVKRLSLSSESGDAKKGSNSQSFIPFLKIVFDIQVEAHKLLSWLKLAIRAIRNRRWITTSVQSLIMYKDFSNVLASFEFSFKHLHSFTEQLTHFTRPVSLSVTLPFVNESNQKPIFSHASYSPRTVLAKDYIQVLKLIDSLWSKVVFHLRSFGENVNDLTVLLTLQNEISALSHLITDVSQKAEVIFHSIEPQFLTSLPSTGSLNVAAIYNGLKIEHLRLKKISLRLDNLLKLVKHLEGSSSEKPWFDLSNEGNDIVQSAKSKIAELANRVRTVWLRQLEMREILKMLSNGVSPNQLPLLPEFNPTKLRSASILQSNWSNPNQRKQCLCFQRLLSSRSEPCFSCLMCLRGCKDSRDTNPQATLLHFKASGESGFVSDSDSALRRRRNHRRDDYKLTPLPRINRRWSFTLSSDVSISLYQSYKVGSISNAQKDKYFEERTPVKQVPTSQLQDVGFISDQPFFIMSPIHASAKRKYFSAEPTLVSPFGRLCCTSSPQRRLSIVSTSNTNSEFTDFGLDNDDDIEHDIITQSSQREAGDPEEDSALITSPTSYSLKSHDSSDQEEEIAEDCDDDEMMANIYFGSNAKKQRCLCRSLPSLSDNASGVVSGGWSVLKEVWRKPLFGSRALLVDTTMDEAYIPITTISSNKDDACEFEDPSLNTRVGDTTTNSSCLPADWSALSCRSEDLANLAAALRLSHMDSAKLHEVLQDSYKLTEWLSSLETSVYSSSPAENLLILSSKPLCRLRPGLTRKNLNGYLHDLESNLGKVQSWQQEVDTLFTKHQKRFSGFESQSSKLLASDHGLLVIFPSWLDMIASRCSEVKRELLSQLRLSEYSRRLSDEREKKLQEVNDQAKPVLAEADYLMEKLGGGSESITDASHVSQDVLAISVVAEKLQDLLERASELDSNNAFVHVDSIECHTDNQILRAYLRSALANLHTLRSRIISSPPTLGLSAPPTSQRCTGLWILVFTMFTLITVFFIGFVQIVWLSEEEIQFHCACGNRKRFLCIASAWSHSLCIFLRTVLPSIESSSNDFIHVPPI